MKCFLFRLILISHLFIKFILKPGVEKFTLLSFERSKESNKEKSSAGNKLPEIHSYWRQFITGGFFCEVC